MTTSFELAALVLLGGLFELDRTSVFHGLFSEPIVVAPIAGFIVGDPVAGLKVGVVLELYFLGSVSMGGSSPPDGALTAIVASAAAGIVGKIYEPGNDAAWVVAVLVTTAPLSRMGVALEKRMKEKNVVLARKLDSRGADPDAAAKFVRRTLLRSYFSWCLLTAYGLAAGIVASLAVAKIAPASALSALSDLGRVLPLLAAGVALSTVGSRNSKAWFVVGCAGGALTAFLLLRYIESKGSI